jgi:4-diphosphocytidyl-2-C-methyl-D-erythritol kinase
MLRARPADGGAAALILRAPAKVNLFLEVVAKRADGFHAVNTLMVAVSLADTLEFALGEDGVFDLTCSDPALSVGPENLVARAAELLRQHAGCRAGARIRLTKRIPMQAGLGGGSSDAATTLLGLNRLWGLGLGVDELATFAASLGSDVAFFLHPPAAWCTGRGEEVSPRTIGRRLHFVLVCPPFGLATAEVYRGVEVPAMPLDGTAIQAALTAGDVDEIGRLLHNRLQPPAERLRPELTTWLGKFAATKPAGCLVSGSGSTIFALARDSGDARRIAAVVAADGSRWQGQETVPQQGARTFIVRSLV